MAVSGQRSKQADKRTSMQYLLKIRMTSYSLHQRQYSSRRYDDRKLPNLFFYKIMSLTLLVAVSYVNITRFGKKKNSAWTPSLSVTWILYV
ncbi:hypothetical protein KsCSTR_48140 [Candidatus Kuenenia stuttgartiensis]|uniref:Uncharacterized protein n=1 Tax=Kuenenia stuttgartiensis TaxID=174633 RepID=Q1PVS6_KUEST|nr:hypothetical protein KsCSTR_48140 [Candidatus Kuenenia stuttgartiensis]CAJ71327.1 unknown protein [Candidatus Kuenenia stuttgartiensis]